MEQPRWIAVACVGALVLAGCGSSSGSAAGGGTKAKTSATASSTIRGSKASRSAGCATTTGQVPVGRSVVKLRSGGRDRSYIRYVPKGLDPAKAAPLVLDLTAYSPASMEESFSGFTKPDAKGVVKADEVGAVVVTPEPVNGKGLLTWNVSGTAGWSDDQRFVTDLLDDVGGAACIDPHRVLAMGFAIGGVMASTIACEQPHRIAVLATVSGLWDPPTCHPNRPTPVISFHGNGDHFLPFDGGVGDHVDQLSLSSETTTGLVDMTTRPGALASSQAWATRNGCTAKPIVTTIRPGVDQHRWSGCEHGADVVLDVIQGGSHTWPGSNGMGSYEALLGPTSHAIDATDAIWDFFEAHT